MLRSPAMVLFCLASMTAVAFGEDATPPNPNPDPAAPADQLPTDAQPAAATLPDTNSTSTVVPAPERAPTGITLRNGFSLSVGQESGSGAVPVSGQLYGVDWRIGAQITNNIALYADTHLSFGSVKEGAASGATGNFATALIGEYTLPARVFVGGGVGFGVLNNPSGMLGHARVGWYPFEKTGEGKSRRLNVAFDARWYAVGEPWGTIGHYALSLGYDRY